MFTLQRKRKKVSRPIGALTAMTSHDHQDQLSPTNPRDARTLSVINLRPS